MINYLTVEGMKERDILREDFENQIDNKNRYNRMMKKIKGRIKKPKWTSSERTKLKSPDTRKRRMTKSWLSFPSYRKRFGSLEK